MVNLLHLPDLAAARPPTSAGGVARRRGAARVVVAAAAPEGRVKRQQQEAGAGRARVIRVADPVRDGRLPVPLLPPPPLFSVPVTHASASESPAATKRRDDDEEERRRYYLNLGYAIRTLREEIPDVFSKEPSFDIYSSSRPAVRFKVQWLFIRKV